MISETRVDMQRNTPHSTFVLFQAKQVQQTASGGHQDTETAGKGSENAAAGKLSPLQALFSPPGLQQMQQFLQQVANNNINGGFNPAQLHHLMQQQQNFLTHHQVNSSF